jgi:hypothetical protein
MNWEAVPAARQNFPKSRSEPNGCWAHTNWIGIDKPDFAGVAQFEHSAAEPQFKNQDLKFKSM